VNNKHNYLLVDNNKHLEEKSWTQENMSYLYWILGSMLFFVLFDLVLYLINGESLAFLKSKDTLVLHLNLFLIPVITVNTIFIVKRYIHQFFLSPKMLFIFKLIALIIGVILGTALVEFISFEIGVADDDYIGFGSFRLSAVMTNFVTNIFFGLVIGVPVFTRQATEKRIALKLKEKEEELDKVYQLKIKSELEAIQAKINPHFLYNSLNSIVSLIHENPEKAEKMVISLSNLFRYSINSGGGNYATLKRELDLVRTYLEIEYVRFQDQLTFEIIMSKELEQVEIPKFLIQPLIENAIKHGTAKIQHGQIKLEVLKIGKDLQISVFDNGPAFPASINSGYGLKSTVDKLDLLYDKDYSFRILNEPEKCVEIRFKNRF
jgi:two-component system LytT family sensor kinase